MTKIVAILLLAASTPAFAQEPADTFELRELVVTATRVPIERGASAASVTVLRGDELRLKGLRNVAEALRTVSGAAVTQSGSYGAFGSLFMRGGESDYVQVLLDGVQVNSPGEHFDFANLTLENIDRIEIVRGPASVLYGSDAVTGVVQLFSRPGSARTQFTLDAAGGRGGRVGATADGSFGSGSLNAELRGGVGRLAYAAGVSHFNTEGAYAFNNQHSNTGITARATLTPDQRTDLAATVRYNQNTFHYPTDGAGNLVDANQHHTADAVTVGVDVGRRLSPRLEARAQLGLNRNDDNYMDAPDNSADTLGFYAFYSDERIQRQSADVRLNYSFATNSVLTVGGEVEQQRERGSSLSESEFGPFEGLSGEERANRAAYAQVIGAVSKLSFQAGARVEDNERFGGFATYRGGVSAQLSRAVRVRASAGTGFKQPRFYEQFATGFVKGNPELEPERSRSVEAGVEVARRASRIGVTYFAQRFRDLIQYVGVPADPNGPNYLNLGAVRANGLEVEAGHQRGALQLRGSITVLDTKVTDAGTGDDPLYLEGRKLIRRPDQNASLSAAWARPSWSVSATANYTSERDDLDFSGWPPERVQLAAYTRLDLAGETRLWQQNIRATLKVENALNESYQEVHNFPARGRVVFLGFRYNN